MISKAKRREDEAEHAKGSAEAAVRRCAMLFGCCGRGKSSYRTVTQPVIHFVSPQGLSYPREVIGNVWKFLTRPIAIVDVERGAKVAGNKLRF